MTDQQLFYQLIQSISSETSVSVNTTEAEQLSVVAQFLSKLKPQKTIAMNISQSGGAVAPDMIMVLNETEYQVTWTYVAVGSYAFVLPGDLTSKALWIVGGGYESSQSQITASIVYSSKTDETSFGVSTREGAGWPLTSAEGLLDLLSCKLEIYE